MKKIFLLSTVILGLILQVYGQLDTLKIDNIVNEWSDAHNNSDYYNKLDKLFAPKLLFYCQELSKEECLKKKYQLLESAYKFKQKIVSNIEITAYESGIIKCDFTKEVLYKNKTKNYPSYLLLRLENEKYLIVGEGDKITDSNLKYSLDLGKQITILNSSENLSTGRKYNLIFILFGVILLAIIILIYFTKNKSKNIKSESIAVSDNIIEITTQSNSENKTENVFKSETENNSTVTIENIKENYDESKKEYLNQAFTQTKTAITKLFDTVDIVDRALYGKRMRIFILGSVLVLIVAPLIDLILGIKKDWFTFYSTFSFFIFILILFLSLISSWRDDTGNWSIKRVFSKLRIYFSSIKDTAITTSTNSMDENLYKFGKFLFFSGIGWKALQNISVFIRKPIEHFNINLISLRKFEKFTNIYYWIPIVLGIVILIYIYYKNPNILKRIKNELRHLFGFKQSENSKYTSDIITIVNNSENDLVINARTEQQINTVIASSNSNLFNDFAVAIQNWSPRGAYYEYEYQDRLERHLTKYLPEASIKTEFPIGDKLHGNKGRADIVINDTILIELKRDSSAGAIQRAKGQMVQYSDLWQNKGPVILLLCDYDYEHAKLAFSSTMNDLARLERPVFTIVAKTKKNERLTNG